MEFNSIFAKMCKNGILATLHYLILFNINYFYFAGTYQTGDVHALSCIVAATDLFTSI